jgi:hypothetical protein
VVGVNLDKDIKITPTNLLGTVCTKIELHKVVLKISKNILPEPT